MERPALIHHQSITWRYITDFVLPEKGWQGEICVLTDIFSCVNSWWHHFGKFSQETPALPSKDDVDSVPQKDQSSVVREPSTVLDKYKDVSSAKFSNQENDPEAS